MPLLFTDIQRFVLAGFKAHGADGFMQAIADGWIRQIQFPFHAIDLAFASNKSFNEFYLFSGQPRKGAIFKSSFDDRIASIAMIASNQQVISAYRTFIERWFHFFASLMKIKFWMSHCYRVLSSNFQWRSKHLQRAPKHF